MANFNRVDICQAHYQLEVDYNNGGWLHERPSNRHRKMATHVQIHRMALKKNGQLTRTRFECCRCYFDSEWKGYDGLTSNGKEIYHLLEKRYGFVP